MSNTITRTVQRKSFALSLAAAGCSLMLTAAHPAAAQSYTVANLGTLGSDTQAYGLSAGGAATGASNIANGASQAFLTLPGGTIQNLGTLGGANSYGQAVTTTGPLTQVTGYSDTGVGATQHAFLSTSTGVGTPIMRDLGTLSGVATDNSQAFGINTLGQTVGNSINVAGADDAFRTSPNANVNGTTDDLGTLGGTSSNANAINTSGQVTGNSLNGNDDDHAFRSTATGLPVILTDLGTLGGTFSVGNAINASGQVAGQSSLAGDASYHAFVWTQGATNGVAGNMQMTDLGSLGGDSGANSINDAGAIVGYSFLSDGATFDAFLYQNGKMVDLNTLIKPASGWVLQYASAINNNGQIAGYGTLNGQNRAFLLTLASAPEPSALTVLAIGLGALGLLAVRKRRATLPC